VSSFPPAKDATGTLATVGVAKLTYTVLSEEYLICAYPSLVFIYKWYSPAGTLANDHDPIVAAKFPDSVPVWTTAGFYLFTKVTTGEPTQLAVISLSVLISMVTELAAVIALEFWSLIYIVLA